MLELDIDMLRNIPPEILESARKIELYFANQNISNWKLRGIQSIGETYLKDMKSAVRHEADCVDAAQDRIRDLERTIAAKQAKIDALMLEFCPSEMTAEQVEEWGRHQVPVSRETTLADRILSIADAVAPLPTIQLKGQP